MRQLNTRRHQRGLTLIELLVTFTIMGLLGMAAAPYFADYSTNSRLRESGNALYAETLFAQSEAIKRNRVVRVATSGSTITVSDMTVPDTPVVLRTRELSGGVTAASGTVDFGTQGWPVNFATGSINLAHSSATCSSDYRCPGLRVDAGGAVRLCGNYLSGCT